MRFFLLPAGGSRPVPTPPWATVKATAEDSEGRFTLLEVNGEVDLPGRVQEVADEFVYVIDGAVEVDVDRTTHHLTAGMCVMVPRGVPHAIRTAGAPVHALHLLSHGAAGVGGKVDGGYVLARGEVRPGRIRLPPAFSVKARSSDTGGLFSLLEVTVAQPIPRHTHHVADECIYVLDGALEIDFGGTTYTARKGQFVLLPRGAPHAIRPGSAPPPRVVQISTPGGWELVVEALIEHRTEVSKGGRFNPTALNRYTTPHHVTYDTP
ncbi:cupin domain-containing protein [Amycolatopsis thermoflava]